MEISKTEWTVMEALWPLGRATTREIYERLKDSGESWSFSTVKTLLLRLEEKGVVAGSKFGRSVTYEVRVKRPTALKRAFDRFLDQFTGGSISPLASYLAEAKELSEEDLAALREIVEAADKKNRGGRRS
jgi:predicted transcriptional regulator